MKTIFIMIEKRRSTSNRIRSIMRNCLQRVIDRLSRFQDDGDLADKAKSLSHRSELCLPESLDTVRARFYFLKAIKEGWFEVDCETGGLKWRFDHSKAHNASMAYFLAKVYEYQYQEGKERSDEKALLLKSPELAKLVGCGRILDSLKQAYNAKAIQPWRKEIDRFFEKHTMPK